jgi:hypothetical protein
MEANDAYQAIVTSHDNHRTPLKDKTNRLENPVEPYRPTIQNSSPTTTSPS